MGLEETTALHVNWSPEDWPRVKAEIAYAASSAGVLEAFDSRTASDIELLGQGLRNEVADCNRKMRHMLGMLSKIADRLSEKDSEDLAGFISSCIEEFEGGR